MMGEVGHRGRHEPTTMQRDLVLRARSGDHDAFTALAASAFDHLHRTARLILRSDDRAADAVQEALMAAWLHIRAVRDPDRFDAWLHRLLIHACYREARRTARRQIVEIQISQPDALATGDAQASTAIRDQLERGFRRLTPEQRTVLVVHYYLELRDADAAIVLGIAVGTFKSRLNRAAAALRAALEADERRPTIATASIP
jgi:RNA polymerase sigma-70 factor (ECF subfamily)